MNDMVLANGGWCDGASEGDGGRYWKSGSGRATGNNVDWGGVCQGIGVSCDEGSGGSSISSGGCFGIGDIGIAMLGMVAIVMGLVGLLSDGGGGDGRCWW